MPNTLEDDLKASLQACGVPRRRSVLVSHFVGQCMGLAHAAHDRLTQPAAWAAFLNKRGALSKTLSGRPRVKETAVSADLALQAQGLLKRRAKANRRPSPKGFIASDAISLVQADVLEPSAMATGNSSKRPDLVFAPADAELELAFAVEAKVLEGQHDCRDVLLGAEGIGCFTRTQDPYESNGVIGLFGYAERSAASRHRTSLHTSLVGGRVPGCGTVDSSPRVCAWDDASKHRESTLAHPAASKMVCLAVVLDFPSIRQPVSATTTTLAPRKRATTHQAGAGATPSTAKPRSRPVRAKVSKP